MAAFQIALQHNNYAASLIEQGKLDDAIASLTPCIRTLREYRNIQQGEEATTTTTPVISSCFDLAKTLDQFMAIRPDQHQQQQDDMMDTDGSCTSNNSINMNKSCYQSGGFTYDRAVYVPEVLSVTSNPKSFALATVVVMFNLALAHHLKAATSLSAHGPYGIHQHQSFLKAARLYELCYNLIVKQDLMDSSSIQFSLAIVNNLGMIYHALNETAKAKKYFEQSLSIIMFMVDNGMGDSIDQLDGYFRNTTTFGGIGTKRSVTAAAA